VRHGAGVEALEVGVGKQLTAVKEGMGIAADLQFGGKILSAADFPFVERNDVPDH
jgi:hypothetical protein